MTDKGMNPEHENIEALRRLLKLKRYEQPPPRYFNDFSAQIIARIKAGGTQDHEGVLERFFVEAPWVQRVLGVFEAKPAVAWVFGGAVCALLVSGIVYSETLEVTPVVTSPLAKEIVKRQEIAATAPTSFTSPAGTPMLLASTNDIDSSVSGSLFDQIPKPESWQIDYRRAE